MCLPSANKRKLFTLGGLILVFVFFVLVRLPLLGFDTFNTDVWKWKARSYDFGSGIFTLSFEKTIQKYHPGVTLLWLGTFGVKVYNLYYDVAFKTAPPDNSINTVFELNVVQKVLVVLAIALTMVYVFYALKHAVGLKYAVFATFFMTLEPFYVALTREIHLEGLMSTFMIASFVWLYYYLQTKKRRHIVTSAVFGSLAVLTKTSALFLLPFTGLILFLDVFYDSRFFGRSVVTALKKYAVWIITFIIVCVLIWPALWSYPAKAFEALYKGIFVVGLDREHEQFYFGKYVLDPGPTFYVVVLLLRSSPLLLLGLAGAVWVRRAIAEERHSQFVLYALLFSALYLLEITLPSKKLDRYILPSMLSLWLAATFFYVWAAERLRRSLFKYLLVAPFALPLITLVYLHPNYFSYYNPLFGGLKTGIFVIEPKWVFGQQELMSYFDDLRKEQHLEVFAQGEAFDAMLSSPQLTSKLVVAFPEKYYTQLWPFVRKIGGWAVIGDLTPHAKKANYFVYPVWNDEAKNENRVALDKIGVIKVRNVPIYVVYKKI